MQHDPCGTYLKESLAFDARSILIHFKQTAKARKFAPIWPEAFSWSSCQELNKPDQEKGIASVTYYVRRVSFNYDPICEEKRQQGSPSRNSGNLFWNFKQRFSSVCQFIFRLPRKSGRKWGSAPQLHYKLQLQVQTIVQSCNAGM